MYKSVIREVVGLLGAEQKQSVTFEENVKGDLSRTWKKQTRKKKQAAQSDRQTNSRKSAQDSRENPMGLRRSWSVKWHSRLHAQSTGIAGNTNQPSRSHNLEAACSLAAEIKLEMFGSTMVSQRGGYNNISVCRLYGRQKRGQYIAVMLAFN
jgi:hypothetical protein